MASRRLPNSVQKKTTELYRRDQHQSNAHPFESKVINPQVCLHCGEEIADLSKVFVGKCCKNQYLCWNCHSSTTSRSFFHRSCCGQDLFRNGFQLQDLSGVLISAPPKCYSCDLEVKLEYILPGDLKICSDCFDKGMFNRSVKRTDKMQFFIGLKTNNIISSMELFPIQCVHKIVYDNRNNCQGLACVGCQELLQGNYYELECNHFACLMCCDCIVYCTICRASFNRTCPVEFRGMQHPNLFHRKVAVAEENKETKKNRYGNPCTAHGKICIRITCGTSLCSDCFNEMADRRVSVIYGSGAAEEHCICICKPTKGQHIISVASLIETESQIEYLKDIAFGHCSGCYKYRHGLMEFLGDTHQLCFECVSERLHGKHFHRQYNKLNGKNRIFLTCGVHDCAAMVPIDMLPSFIKKLMSASSNLLDSERETVENLVSHATLISSEAKDVLLKKEKDLAAGSLNKENEDASLLPSSVTTTGIDKFSHFEFAGKSSYSSKDTQSEEHKHESGTTSELGMKSSSGQIEDKLSPPQSADNGQEKRDKEPVGTLKVTDKGNDSKGPSKKRTKAYIKEKPLTDWCSRNKNHEKAIIEFSECSHRLCGYCVKSITCNNSPTVYCGTMIGNIEQHCLTKVPSKEVSKYLRDRVTNNMDWEPTEDTVKMCDNPSCKAKQTSDSDIDKKFPCGHRLCVYCANDEEVNTTECNVPSCVKIKLPSKGRCSEVSCSNLADAEFTSCRHLRCFPCLLKLCQNGEKRRKSVFCGIRKWLFPFESCQTIIPIALLTSYIMNIKDKPSLYLNGRPFKRYCYQRSCHKKAVIEFRKCTHCICKDCVLKKANSGTKTVTCDDGMRYCKTEVPINVIMAYLNICDNPRCKAHSKSDEKRDIRKTFPCGHNLCVICVSEQQHSYEDEVVCMASACNPSQTEAMDIAGIPNVGLTCYASCVLQVLGQTPKFTSMLREFANGTSKHGVAAHLDELLTHVNKVGNSQNLSVNWDSMNNLMHAIFTLDPSFQRYQENDCHSFIMSLFNALAKTDEDRKEKKPKPIENSFLDGTGMDETSNSRAEDSWEGRRSTSHGDGSTARRDDTCPTKLFESRIASKFKYSTCNHTENVADQLFYSLLLSATKDVTSIHCGLDLYFKSEDFTHNQVPCRECTKQVEHTTTSRTPLLSSAPQILMIQLARFGEISRHGGDYKELAKTYHSVEFEKTLRIGPSATADKRELKYELYGVVLHRGNMHGGHYTSCVRNLKSKKWYSCSDSSVSETSEEELLQERAFKHAYLLFYSRKA